jgi:DNA-binding IclR family transcriptional regulator
MMDPHQYLSEIRLVRQRGYATDYEEYILGVRAVASPIEGKGQLRSAIWAVGFRASLNEENMKILIKETKKAAEAIRRGIQEQSGN